MQVWARDPDRVRRGQLTVLEARCVLRETGVGTWTMTVDETAQWSPTVEEGWGVVALNDDGTTLFSGPVTQIEISRQGRTRDVTLTGVTDMVNLDERAVYPDPSKGYTQQTTVSHYKAKGPAETLILDLVRGQCAPDPSWPTAIRRVPGLMLPVSQGRGVVTSVEARFTDLLTEVQGLATVGGLVVDIAQVGQDLALTVREPADRSRAVRFLPGRGLGDYSMRLTAPTVTTVIVMGQGQGTDRFVTGRSAPTADRWGGRRIEDVRDRRDTTDVDEMNKTITEVLEEGAPSASATLTVEEVPGLVFGADYQLGDVVTVGLPGSGEITDGVRVADITWTPHGRTVQLTVGEHSTDEDKAPAWVRKQRDLLRRVRRQETSL